MASILRVNTITDASSNNSTAVSVINQGTAKVWVQFAGSSLSGTGTTGVDDSFNLTSMTDDDTGRYTVNINSDMNNNDYAVHSTIGQSASAIGDYITNIASLATGTVQVGSSTRGGSYADSAVHSVTIHGDLA
jgi:hypothetical protein|tara:strand:+ start:356 stop:754 length:399 start_codon:yes stop_codon:yes gene_type:complete